MKHCKLRNIFDANVNSDRRLNTVHCFFWFRGLTFPEIMAVRLQLFE